MSNKEAYAYFNNLFLDIGYVEYIGGKTVHVLILDGKMGEAKAIAERVKDYRVLLFEKMALATLN